MPVQRSTQKGQLRQKVNKNGLGGLDAGGIQ